MSHSNISNPRAQAYLIPLLILGALFFVIGFGVGISGILIPFLQDAFQLSTIQSYMVTGAIFSAFVVFGIPSGYVTQKVGYKKAMVIAFFIMAIGMLLFVPSAKYESFALFLVALFVGGIGNTLLQASVNPYVTIIGPKESAAMRISLMGIMNKAAWWLGPLFLGIFLDVKKANLADIVSPFYLVAAILTVLGLLMLFAPLPEIVAEEQLSDTDTSSEKGQKQSVLQHPQLLLGVVALFFYVGVETLPMASIIDFAKLVFPDTNDLTNFAIYVPAGLVTGYLFGVLMIPRYLSQTTVLVAFSILGLVSALALIYLPPHLAIYCFIALGFSNSLMWPAIWPLAIDGLGSLTKKGASLLVMGIVGGAVIPFVFGLILNQLTADVAPTIGHFQQAYWVLIPPYLFILFYAIWGHQMRCHKK